jgi:hypothetical protein
MIVRRREFIALLTGITAGWPITADTQQTSRKEAPVVGFLVLGSPYTQEIIKEFQTGLAGWDMCKIKTFACCIVSPTVRSNVLLK